MNLSLILFLLLMCGFLMCDAGREPVRVLTRKRNLAYVGAFYCFQQKCVQIRRGRLPNTYKTMYDCKKKCEHSDSMDFLRYFS
ncbi:unnamed protein product [Cylicocyclus nassatus]|uniref:Uncharacterized protein n=1 Tax=Cylicocyclus nassatus TaxID=53992 RepID=A0AA36DPG2_CYLNA|nr:unnamed protein product [Cylicocyclus nassatus]